MGQPKKKPNPLPTVREVFEEHGPYVYRALRYFGVPEADLPDVFQEVFVVVHRKLPEFEGRSQLSTWLFRIAQRAASTHRRKAHVRRELVTETPQDMAGATSVVAPASRVEARTLLLQAMDKLDEDKRTVFVLFEIEGKTMKEIAEILQCPLQTAYSRLHAARKVVIQTVEEAEL